MEPYGPFLLATAVGAILIAITWLFTRKSGLLPAQTALIDTLQKNGTALQDQVNILERELKSANAKVRELGQKVEKMETIILDLVSENNDLRKKNGLPPRRVKLDTEDY